MRTGKRFPSRTRRRRHPTHSSAHLGKPAEASGRRLEHGSVEPSWMLDLRCLNRLCSAAGGRTDFDRAINSTMFTHPSPHPTAAVDDGWVSS